MKRTVTVILIAILIVSSTLLLTACGGATEEEWNKAMDFLKNCEAVTISYGQEKTTNARTTKTQENWTVQYDATNGMLYAEQNVRVYNLFGVMTEQTRQYRYVEVAGTEVKDYTKNRAVNHHDFWKLTSNTCGSEEEALEKLKQVYLSYLTLLGLDGFNYADFTYKFGKYKKTDIVNQKETSWQLTFSDGKFTKAYYETKHVKGSSDIDYTKLNVEMKYSAEVTEPSDLDTAV